MKSNIKKLGKNYNDEDIKFDENKLNDHYDKISAMILDDIVNKDLSVWQGKKILKKIYDVCDRGIAEFSSYASCKRGCSSCCCIYLDCTAVEAELIREYVREKFTDEQIKKIEELVHNNKKEVPGYRELLKDEKEVSYKYMKKKMPCIFLKEDKSCSIYEVRPFNCRKLINFSHRELCENKESITVPRISVNYIAEYAINHLAMNITRYRRLKNYSKDSNEDKAIYKSLFHWFESGFDDINREI